MECIGALFRRRARNRFLALACIVVGMPEPSLTVLRPDGADCPPPLVGSNRTHRIEEGQTLVELARAAHLGFGGLMAANPGVDPWIPEVGSEVLLPYETALPGPLEPGITINLAEMRLYLLERRGDELTVRVYPIGIGSEGYETPLGEYEVVTRLEKPAWTPPPSVRRDRPELPRVVPAGPENPLGAYWLGLSAPGIGIHGTNEPYGIGRRVSRGCIRLYPEDIADLFPRVKRRTPVRILYQPVKAGVRGDTLFAEAHPDLLERVPHPREAFVNQVAGLGWEGALDWRRLEEILRDGAGTPVAVAIRDSAAAGDRDRVEQAPRGTSGGKEPGNAADEDPVDDGAAGD